MENKVFDKDEALKMLEDDEDFLKELADIFINDSPGQISKIKEAIDSRNSNDLEKSAHCLKGAVANFGKNTIIDTAFKLEMMGKENRLDGVEGIYDTLAKDTERLVNALREFVKN